MAGFMGMAPSRTGFTTACDRRSFAAPLIIVPRSPGAANASRDSRIATRQKFTLNENCMDLLSTIVDVMRPAVGESKFWFGNPKPG